MIRLLTGKTGSGKSYQAVSMIIDILNTGKTVFTNIKIELEYDNYHYIDELGVKAFLLYIDKTFSNVNNLEDKKHELQNTKYFEADFFIDEAHLVGFRDKKEAILNWLTIHRHFNQNITVITQVPTNIHRDYLMLFHSHIDMIPPNKRLSKNSMGYKEFDSYKGDRLHTKYFKPDLNIFEVYNSGNVEQGINQDVYKLGALLVGMVVLAVFAYWSTSSFFENDMSTSLVPIAETQSDSLLDLDKKLTGLKIVPIDENVSIVVKSESVICSNLDGCRFGAVDYDPNTFKMYVLTKYKDYKEELIAIINIGKKKERLTKYTFLTK